MQASNGVGDVDGGGEQAEGEEVVEGTLASQQGARPQPARRRERHVLLEVPPGGGLGPGLCQGAQAVHGDAEVAEAHASEEAHERHVDLGDEVQRHAVQQEVGSSGSLLEEDECRPDREDDARIQDQATKA
eukprot:CAMPEP_0204593308 /NCGR_PEP_ID=MMETSP0661-20131031/51431_1 /ASSEMBLY_ACC=CAM_ASM_000606 /TAXON_ID=109239 /ORGANISM="Alexandrium margalefi, Strain AMGDE01CS-322" /LENGTH=130 /DNA_ID=CAMNT_0051603603 /DNA_START=105 /DNA_END=497 /DNA_ORIENTATION=-